MKLKYFLMIAIGALVAGCTNSQPGQGPILLSATVEGYYQEYLARPEPMAFAVTADGNGAGYVYCPDRYGCRGGERTDAVRVCERAFKRTCHLYDHLGEVVWRTDLPPLAAN